MTMARILTVVLCVIYVSSLVNCQEAVLHVSNGVREKDYCLVYNSSWSNISATLSDAEEYPLENMVSSFLCNSQGLAPDALKGKAVVVLRGICQFSDKALVAQAHGATAILIATNTTLVTPSANDSEYAKVTIPVALMRSQDIADAEEVFGSNMQIKMYAPKQSLFDFSILVMLFISMFTIGMGGWWSGVYEREKLDSASGMDSLGTANSNDVSIYSPTKILLFVMLMCVMLVLMYFFYKYLVYVIIAIFCLASATALYNCFQAILEKLGVWSRLSCLGLWRYLVLAALCIAVVVVWVVFRNDEKWIWILQDLLGIAFCINFMKTISVSNFKVCVILLCLLLVYDVFFVFITPFLTPNGESIMVQVAVGPGASGEKSGGNMVAVPVEPSAPYEKLPVVMRVPRFSSPNVCEVQFSILGYGDLIVPGLLVAYCHRFDVWTGSAKIYFACCTMAYFFGIVVTFVVMILSQMGQPALLYLVPFTLITSFVVAWQRKELKHFWQGRDYNESDPSQEPLIQDGEPRYGSNGGKC